MVGEALEFVLSLLGFWKPRREPYVGRDEFLEEVFCEKVELEKWAFWKKKFFHRYNNNNLDTMTDLLTRPAVHAHVE